MHIPIIENLTNSTLTDLCNIASQLVTQQSTRRRLHEFFLRTFYPAELSTKKNSHPVERDKEQGTVAVPGFGTIQGEDSHALRNKGGGITRGGLRTCGSSQGTSIKTVVYEHHLLLTSRSAQPARFPVTISSLCVFSSRRKSGKKSWLFAPKLAEPPEFSADWEWRRRIMLIKFGDGDRRPDKCRSLIKLAQFNFSVDVLWREASAVDVTNPLRRGVFGFNCSIDVYHIRRLPWKL